MSFDHQYVIFAALAVAGAGLYAGAVTLNRVLRPSLPHPEKLTTYECGVDPVGSGWAQVNIRYYVFAFLFVIFDVEAAFLFPWATALATFDGVATSASAWYAFIAMVIFIVVPSTGLPYAFLKGLLRWD